MMHKKYQGTHSTASRPKCKLIVNSLVINSSKEQFLYNQFLRKSRRNWRNRDRAKVCQTDRLGKFWNRCNETVSSVLVLLQHKKNN